MAIVKKDFRGLRCPVPTLKLVPVLQKETHPGDTLVVLSDCAEFETAIKKWAVMWKKQLINLVSDGTTFTATLRV